MTATILIYTISKAKRIVIIMSLIIGDNTLKYLTFKVSYMVAFPLGSG